MKFDIQLAWLFGVLKLPHGRQRTAGSFHTEGFLFWVPPAAVSYILIFCLLSFFVFSQIRPKVVQEGQRYTRGCTEKQQTENAIMTGKLRGECCSSALNLWGNLCAKRPFWQFMSTQEKQFLNLALAEMPTEPLTTSSSLAIEMHSKVIPKINFYFQGTFFPAFTNKPPTEYKILPSPIPKAPACDLVIMEQQATCIKTKCCISYLAVEVPWFLTVLKHGLEAGSLKRCNFVSLLEMLPREHIIMRFHFLMNVCAVGDFSKPLPAWTFSQWWCKVKDG